MFRILGLSPRSIRAKSWVWRFSHLMCPRLPQNPGFRVLENPESFQQAIQPSAGGSTIVLASSSLWPKSSALASNNVRWKLRRNSTNLSRLQLGVLRRSSAELCKASALPFRRCQLRSEKRKFNPELANRVITFGFRNFDCRDSQLSPVSCRLPARRR